MKTMQQGWLSNWLVKHEVVHRSLGFEHRGIETLQIKAGDQDSIAVILYVYGYNYLRSLGNRRTTLHSQIPKRTDKGKPAILYIVITCQKESLTENNNRSMRRTSNGILEIVRSCIHGGMHSCHAFCVIRGCQLASIETGDMRS